MSVWWGLVRGGLMSELDIGDIWLGEGDGCTHSEVVTETMSDLGNCVSGTRCDENDVCPAS